MPQPDSVNTGSTYEIQFQGKFDRGGPGWFDGWMQATEMGTGDSLVTCLTVRVPDQAALRGLLNRLWDLNRTLISVREIETGPAKETDHDG